MNSLGADLSDPQQQQQEEEEEEEEERDHDYGLFDIEEDDPHSALDLGLGLHVVAAAVHANAYANANANAALGPPAAAAAASASASSTFTTSASASMGRGGETDVLHVVLGEAPSPSPSQHSPRPSRVSSTHNLAMCNRADSSSNLLLMRRVGSTFFSVSGSIASDMDLLESYHSHSQERFPDAGTRTRTGAAAGAGAGCSVSGSSFVTTSTNSHSSAVAAAPSFETTAGHAGAGVGDGDGDGAHSLPTVPSQAQMKGQVPEVKWNVADILYHDIMMNVFSFLPASDLASFSETGRRPNFDVFYYLRLQLERALLLHPTANDGDEMSQCKRSSFHTTTVDLGGDGRQHQQQQHAPTSSMQLNGAAGEPGEPTLTTATPGIAAPTSKPRPSSSTCPIAVCGAGILSRLATIDRAQAEDLVEQYRSGSGPSAAAGTAGMLSSSPAMRADAALRELQHRMNNATIKEKGAASCAVVFTVLGAANRIMDGGLMHGMENALHSSVPTSLQMIPAAQQAALLGCAGLGLVATRYAANNSTAAAGSAGGEGGEAGGGIDRGAAAGESAAAAMARRMQALLMTLPRPEVEGAGEGGMGGGVGSVFPLPIVERLARQFHPGEEHTGVEQDSSNDGSPPPRSSTRRQRRGKRTKRKSFVDAADTTAAALHAPFSPDPYEHVDFHDESKKARSKPKGDERNYSESEDDLSSDDSASKIAAKVSTRRKPPSGCIGSYANVLRRATEVVAKQVLSKRQEAFDRLTDDEKTQATTAFIDACSDDSNLELVQDLVRNVGVDVNGFYVGSDGTTETCGLHTAAFNDAVRVVEFLCSGIDERDSSKDGGLCDVDVVDENLWTALHFAAGADSANGVRVLASFGAKMTVEALNGYTPFHWAERLSCVSAAEELRRLGADDRFVFGKQSRPLAFLANRFFALMPTAIPATAG